MVQKVQCRETRYQAAAAAAEWVAETARVGVRLVRGSAPILHIKRCPTHRPTARVGVHWVPRRN